MALIHDAPIVRYIIDHLAIPTAPPRFQAARVSEEELAFDVEPEQSRVTRSPAAALRGARRPRCAQPAVAGQSWTADRPGPEQKTPRNTAKSCTAPTQGDFDETILPRSDVSTAYPPAVGQFRGPLPWPVRAAATHVGAAAGFRRPPHRSVDQRMNQKIRFLLFVGELSNSNIPKGRIDKLLTSFGSRVPDFRVLCRFVNPNWKMKCRKDVSERSTREVWFTMIGIWK